MTDDCAVYDDGVLRITSTADPPGLTLDGEIDESTYHGLVRRCRPVRQSPGEVHFSLGGVRYCDLAGLRAIVRVTGIGDDDSGNGGGDGRRVVLHEVPAAAARACCGSSAGTPPRAWPWTSRRRDPAGARLSTRSRPARERGLVNPPREPSSTGLRLRRRPASSSTPRCRSWPRAGARRTRARRHHPANLELIGAALGERAATWTTPSPRSSAAARRARGRVLPLLDQGAPATARGSARVRILAEPVWAGRSAREIAAWTRMESALNVALAPASISMICPYDTRTLDPGIVADALRTHPARIAGSDLSPCRGVHRPGAVRALL